MKCYILICVELVTVINSKRHRKWQPKTLQNWQAETGSAIKRNILKQFIRTHRKENRSTWSIRVYMADGVAKSGCTKAQSWTHLYTFITIGCKRIGLLSWNTGITAIVGHISSDAQAFFTTIFSIHVLSLSTLDSRFGCAVVVVAWWAVTSSWFTHLSHVTSFTNTPHHLNTDFITNRT